MNKNISQSKLYGIFGCSLKQTLSPEIHNFLFRKYGLACFYSVFEIEKSELQDAVKGFKALGLAGANVTYPYKEIIIPYLDRLHPTAAKVGAVNTILNIKNSLVGYNTDLFGIRATIEDRLKLNLKGQTVFVLGAGGTASAVLHELKRAGVKKTVVVNRTIGRAREMISAFGKNGYQKKICAIPASELADVELDNNLPLVINCTSASVSYLERVIRTLSKKEYFTNCQVFDMNYGWRSLSADLMPGHKYYEDGLYMLSAQASESFRLWTKIKTDPLDIYKHLLRLIKKESN